MAFLLGLIAFFLPGANRDREGEDINYFLAFAGFQQALSDLGGFCERAPAACGAGSQIAGFVLNRIGDGLEYGYALVRGRTAEMAPTAIPASGPAAQPAAAPQPAQAVLGPVQPEATGNPAANPVPHPLPRPAG